MDENLNPAPGIDPNAIAEPATTTEPTDASNTEQPTATAEPLASSEQPVASQTPDAGAETTAAGAVEEAATDSPATDAGAPTQDQPGATEEVVLGEPMLSTDAELDAFLKATETEAPTYVGEAPQAPYHLIDTEHHVLNAIASHLDKARDEAIAAIEAIETSASNFEVATYKAKLLAWLRAQ